VCFTDRPPDGAARAVSQQLKRNAFFQIRTPVFVLSPPTKPRYAPGFFPSKQSSRTEMYDELGNMKIFDNYPDRKT